MVISGQSVNWMVVVWLLLGEGWEEMCPMLLWKAMLLERILTRLVVGGFGVLVVVGVSLCPASARAPPGSCSARAVAIVGCGVWGGGMV
jgi:hypothetical protein